ncbi:MAG: LPS export ABC transporter periplasmic protein LptC, partial [Acidobacteriota bacterium]|nr:LPS export ABC transporter periplasmic protein LptC [Acidobacteriota bacterium]
MKKTPLELQEKHYSDRRKGLKWLLVLVLLLAAAAVAYGIWASFGRRNQAVNIPVTLPKNVSRQLSGYTFTRTVKGREVFTIHAARTLAYEGALTELDDVRVIIYGPGGDRQDEVTTDKCRYDNRTGALACAGRAELTIEPSSTPGGSGGQGPAGGQSVRLVTSNVAYDPQDATIRTPDPVTFTAGTTVGAADGLAYNTRSGNLVLRKDVSFVLSGETGGSAQIAAGGLIYDKRVGRISLSSPVTIEQGTQKISAEAGVVLLDSQNRVSHLELTGVQARDSGGGGEITSTAGHLEAGLNPATGRVQLISGNGGVTVNDHDMKSGALRRLSADSATLTLPPPRSPSGPRFATA